MSERRDVPLRVVHVYKDYAPVLGGIENHVRVLAEAQAAAGHDVSVLVCSPGRRTVVARECGVKVIRAGRLCTLASMPISVAQPLELRRIPADVVHVHSPYPLGEAAAWLLRRRTPLVITHQADVVRQRRLLFFYAPVWRRVLVHARRIVASSPRYIETSPWISAHRDKCRVVPLGVDHQLFRQSDRPPAGKGRLLFVGKLRYYKGLEVLLQAMTRLPRTTLAVVGDGPMRKNWEALAAELGVAGRVTFRGEAPDAGLPALYRDADLFVLPSTSRAEAFGTVLLEAMACGLPCVTTEVGGGSSWVVQDGVTGRVVPPGDAVALADAIAELAFDAGILSRLGLAGRARVEESFTREAMVRGVMAVYREALAERQEEVE